MLDDNLVNLIAETNYNTVVSLYQKSDNKRNAEFYQSEAGLEREFIEILRGQGYGYLNIKSENDLILNLRTQLEKLNNYKFSSSEWQRFFNNVIAAKNDGIENKTQKVQEDYIQLLTRDNNTSKNIKLIDKENINNNIVQVINQYEAEAEAEAKQSNRYDVTVLINGLPLVHIELKRRGVPIKEAFNQIERYQRESFWAGSGLFEYIQIFVISNGTNTKYYSNTTRFNAVKEFKKYKNKSSASFEFTSFWADANNNIIPDLLDFAKTFFAKRTLLNILTKYCVFTSEKMLLVMRPYQITAAERIINKILIAHNYKLYGSKDAGGYIWHTTGSGKTLTSFKTSRIASRLPFINKVLFVVDRKDLDYQTMKEYDRFEQGAADSSTSTQILQRQLEDSKTKIIITTIQKLAIFVNRNNKHEIYNKEIAIIFDECHRSQFGEMHAAIIKKFKKYYIFGFTGTPIFAENTGSAINAEFADFATTEQTFGNQLHAYTIVNAINDKNVLPFKVDYIKTMDKEDEIEDEQVWDINRKQAFEAPERINKIARYILENFDRKTYRGDKTYLFNALQNISELILNNNKIQIEEIKARQRLNGFNSLLAVPSINAAKIYYENFKNIMREEPGKNLKIAVIFSYAANEAEPDENPEDTSGLDQTSREFLEIAIQDYNKLFGTSYDTSSEKFQNYYKDVSLRMKNKELDLLIVVNMFLTGFDAVTLNTLWVDKNLKMHGLIQAFSRTNRILNSVKTFGNIVCFRPLSKRVDEALALFGDNNAGGVVLIRSFKDYYYGFKDEKDGHYVPGYKDLIDKLINNFPVEQPSIIGEQAQRDFINLFGAVLKMRNLLNVFDEFKNLEIISERDFQDYLSKYQDLYDEWRSKFKTGESANIINDIIFETELIKQIEINIDYILILVSQYHASHCQNKEILIKIRKAVDASPSLRSKRNLINEFILTLNNNIVDPIQAWNDYADLKREEELNNIIQDEKLKRDETRKFLEKSFNNGEVNIYGSDINEFMPPVSLFDLKRADKKQRIIDKIKLFFEKFFGIGSAFKA